MVEFKKLILKDTFAFKDLEFSFEPGIHSIVGINGASKTSIYLGLAQGLFNKNPKGTRVDHVSNTITGEPYEIHVNFTKDGEDYLVVNSRKSGTIKVFHQGKDISSKTIPQNLELIREILGEQYETFINNTYQSNDSTLDLLEEATDSARKNFINKILKFDELDFLLAANKDKLKQVKAEVKSVERSIETLKGSLLPIREELPKLDARSSMETLKINQNAFTELSAQYTILTAKRVKIETQVAAKREYVAKMKEAAELEEELASRTSVHSTSEESIRAKELLYKEHTEVNAEYSRCRDALHSLCAPEEICSKCGSSLSTKDAQRIYEEERDRYSERVRELGTKLQELSAYLNSAQLDVELWKRKEAILNKLSVLNNTQVTFESFDSSDLEFIKNSLEDNNTGTKRVLANVDKFRAEIAAIEEHNTKAKLTAKFNKEAEDFNSKAKAKIATLVKELQDLNTRADVLENIIKILGGQGYRVTKMLKFLRLLNHTMEKYSVIISGGRIKCVFKVSEDGKIDFDVVDPDKKQPYANWSSGEKGRLKLMCLFSIIEIQEILGGASFNVLLLDEIFAALDEEGRNGLFDILAYLKDKGKCIYTISHTPIVNPVVFDSTIKVVKEHGISRLL